MQDQPGLFDLPDLQVVAARRAGSGRTRETYARTVIADVTIREAALLRAEALRLLDEGVTVIGEDFGAPDDGPDPRDEVAASPVAALGCCLEPTLGMWSLLDSGAVRIVAIDVTLDEVTEVLVQAKWTVTIKIRDAPAVRELVLAACPIAEVETRAEITASFAALWNMAAEPHAPLTGIPGVDWNPVDVTVVQVLARPGRAGRAVG